MLVQRQVDGDEIDLDAIIDAQALARVGKDEPRVYQRRVRVRRDFACLVLLDISLSSDAWVGNRRVLDVCREAVLVMGEVADGLGFHIPKGYIYFSLFFSIAVEGLNHWMRQNRKRRAAKQGQR